MRSLICLMLLLFSGCTLAAKLPDIWKGGDRGSQTDTGLRKLANERNSGLAAIWSQAADKYDAGDFDKEDGYFDSQAMTDWIANAALDHADKFDAAASGELQSVMPEGKESIKNAAISAKLRQMAKEIQ